MSLDDDIVDRVMEGVNAALAPHLERLAEPEPLTVTVPAAARLLQVSPDTVYRLVDEGRLPVIPHLGTRRLIPRAALERFVAEAEP